MKGHCPKCDSTNLSWGLDNSALCIDCKHTFMLMDKEFLAFMGLKDIET